MTLAKLVPLTLLAALTLLTLGAVAPAAEAASGHLGGRVASGPQPLGGFRVKLMQAQAGAERPRLLGTATSRRNGRFTLRYRRASRNAVHYLVADRAAGRAASARAFRLAASLGSGTVPRRVTVNERTTVAMAFALAQFLDGPRVSGANPGLRNAAAMGANLVDVRSGGLARTLRRYPNGRATATLATLNSLANLVASCRAPGRACDRVLALAAVPGRTAAADTLAAAQTIATHPWHEVGPLFRRSLRAPNPYRPFLARGERPDGWTLAPRFEGEPGTVDGPGGIAIDEGGGLWVANAFEYSRAADDPVCGGETLLRFAPDGHAHPRSPYRGGGLDGAGGGIGFDPRGRLWIGNTGLAGGDCEDVPLGNSVSHFDPDGTPLTPPLQESALFPGSYAGGYEAGGISRPQGTIADLDGNLWVANCGGGTVTRYANGLPARAANLGSFGLARPFGVAAGRRGLVFVTGNGNDLVAVLEADGSLRRLVSGGGLDHPLGVATDSRGYAWVANSPRLRPPCEENEVDLEEAAERGSVTLLDPAGRPLSTYAGAGLSSPWGVAGDGDDTVWVANFGGRRLSHLCGTRPQRCPTGKRTRGAAISPARGYGFDGLTHNAGIAIDPAGNVWLANTWADDYSAANPGGHQVVAFVGLAGPVRTPLVGPPERP
ncbi:MAG: hypothetical protein R2725_02790 [Solirubrobacterales bacterium]